MHGDYTLDGGSLGAGVMIHRPTHLLKGLLVAGIAVAGFAGTSVVAHAYPTPEEEHSLHCSPGAVSPGGTCKLTFTDEAKGEGKGQTVCFSVTGAGTVNPVCSMTNAKGQATTKFTSTGSGCGSEDSPAKVTVVGKEAGVRDEAGRAQTTVTIKCPDKDVDKDKDTSGQTGSGPPAITTTSARTTTAATVAPLSAAQVVPVAAIVAVILVLSVAITGRLRLRRLRR
jgi:hypothetical protein